TGTNAQKARYLTLVLWAVTGGLANLVDDIGSVLGITESSALAAVTDAEWRTFLLEDPQRLPDFTQPGTPAERADAFIRYLKQFFTVAFSATFPQAVAGGGPPTLALSIADVVAWF